MAPTTSLVPPRRLGALLRQARLDAGRDLVDLVEASRESGFSLVDLDDVENGRRDLDRVAIDRLAAVYGLDGLDLVPARSQLVIDLDGGRIGVDRADVPFDGAAGPDAVLTRYLALVYRLRDLPIGTPVPLRDVDLEVLGRALTMPTATIDDRLQGLMATAEDVAADQRRIRRQLLLPLVGVVIAATGVGTLLLVSDGDAPSTVAPGTSTDAGLVEISTAAVEEQAGGAEVGNGGAIETRP